MSWSAMLPAGLVSRLGRRWIDPQEVRAETFALGGRHQGRVIDGARAELKAPGLTLRRALLLRAVVKAQAASPAGRA